MGQKIVIGPINKGLMNNRLPFVIDNDSFPILLNAYQWRGRVKRKRGTSLLGRLNRFLGTTDGSGNLLVTILPTPILPGIASFIIGSDIFTDPGGASPVALITNGSGSATLNRSTGVLTITGSIALTSVIYYPSLPVMGFEDLIIDNTTGVGNLTFDTTYSYNVKTIFPYSIYDVSFYKNPPTSGTYTQKTNWTPTTWNGQNYQQFWSVNYQGAFWTTNGVNVPFSITNIGMQYKNISGVAIVAAGPPATATLTIAGHGLVVGDFIYVNEVQGITGINFQTGYITAVVNANNVTVIFPNATLGGVYTGGGIAQYLTNRSDTTKDCLRWYDGDPTNGNPTSPTFVTGKGWVNFMPPISQSNFSIADLPAAQYYLVGAKLIVPFKDRLLFIGPVVQTSAAGSQVYLPDTVIYSQNGTPYYTSSFTGDPDLSTTTFFPILVPSNQTATAPAYFSDETGFGGFITVGVSQAINTTSSNEDVLILGFDQLQARMIYSGNDIVPFNIFVINSEYGSRSSFSVINMDAAVLTIGPRGIIGTSQTDCDRIDLSIPDEVFEIRLVDNGFERVTSQRDFINEWIYFTYPSNQDDYVFPTQTLMYNYRDKSWAIFKESYTTYGTFRKSSGLTWATVGTVYPTWASWNTPWNSGTSNLLQPDVVGGNQQGFIMFREDGTDEGNSLVIQNIVVNTVSSPNHCLNTGDFITISGALGTVGTEVNNNIFSVMNVTTNTFDLNPVLLGTGTYLGGGLIKRMYIPFIQTKQFPVHWDLARKTRIGVQQYLLSTTENSQITLLIFLSQNDSNPYNDGPIVPDLGSINDSLLYSTVLYTCPESTNLGLTPANTNLQMVTATQQSQIWHRINTSLLGDTVQLGFTLSDSQMRTVDEDGDPISQFSEIELHGIIIDVSPSMVLA
jgi:hypothetical protein